MSDEPLPEPIIREPSEFDLRYKAFRDSIEPDIRRKRELEQWPNVDNKHED